MLQRLLFLAGAISMASALEGYFLAARGIQTVNGHRFSSAFDDAALVIPEKRNTTEEDCAALCSAYMSCNGFFHWVQSKEPRCRLLKYTDLSERDVVPTLTESVSYIKENAMAAILVAEGKNSPNPENPRRFKNAFDPKDIIFKNDISPEECRTACFSDPNCKGAFAYILPEKNLWRCNGLSKITYSLAPTDLTSYSFAVKFYEWPEGHTAAAMGKNFDNLGSPQRFAEAFEVGNLVTQVAGITLDECTSLCLAESACEGVFHYRLGNSWRCRLLKGISGALVKTSYPSYSLKKNINSCIYADDHTKCVDNQGFAGILNVARTETFSSVGNTGEMLADFESNGLNLNVKLSVDDCGADCLYVNPNKAISTDKLEKKLLITFSSNVRAFGANIYTTDEDDEIIPGRWTITCGDYKETLLTSSDTSFFGISFPHKIESCTLISNEGQYVTIDNMVIGFQDPCVYNSDKVTCTNINSFSDELSTAVLEIFSPFVITPGSELDEYVISKGPYSAVISSPSVKYMEHGLFVGFQQTMSTNWIGDELLIEFEPNVNSFGAIFTSMDANSNFLSSSVRIVCDDGREADYTRSVTTNPQFFGFSTQSSISSCKISSDTGAVSIGGVVFGDREGSCVVYDNYSFCKSKKSFLAQVSSSTRETFASAGNVGDKLASFTTTTADGITITYSVEGCTENCLYVNPNNAISTNDLNVGLKITFSPGASSFGANIYSTGEEAEGDQVTAGTWTLTCGNGFTDSHTVPASDSHFFGYVAFDDATSCTLMSNNSLYVTIDNTEIGRSARCIRINGGYRCSDREEFEAKLATKTVDALDALPKEKSAAVEFSSKGNDQEVSFTVEGCTEKCLYSAPAKALSVYVVDQALSIRFKGATGVRAFGANIYSLDDKDNFVPYARWSLVCGDQVYSHVSQSTTAFVGITSAEDFDVCYLFTNMFGAYPTIDNIVFGTTAPCTVSQDGRTYCSDSSKFKELLTVAADESFELTAAGGVGSRLVRYLSSNSGLYATIEVPECGEDCLYVNPNLALSPDKKSNPLVIKFGPGVKAFGARIYSTGEEDELDEIRPGKWTIACAGPPQNALIELLPGVTQVSSNVLHSVTVSDDKSFFGVFGSTEIASCTLISESNLYVTVDDLVFGYKLPCVFRDGVLECDDETAFKKQLTINAFESFGSAGAVSSKLANFETAGNGFSVTYSVLGCEEDCLYVNPNNAISVDNKANALTVTFTGDVNAFGARIYTTGEEADGDQVVPARWTLTCGDYFFSRMTKTSSEYFAIHVPTGLSSCTFTSDVGLYVTIDDVTVGYKLSCTPSGAGKQTCTDVLGFQDELSLAFSNSFSNFAKVLENYPYVSERNGFTVTYSVQDCREDCLHVMTERGAISSNNEQVLTLSFGAEVKAVGAFIFVTDEDDNVLPASWTATCGESVFRGYSYDDTSFFAFTSPSDISSCTFTTSNPLLHYVTLDDVTVGYGNECDTKAGHILCKRSDGFLNKLAVKHVSSFEELAGLERTRTAEVSFEGAGFNGKVTVPDCDTDCVYINPNTAISPNDLNTPLKITFGPGVKAFGANIFVTGEEADGDPVVPGRWTLKCGNFEKTMTTVDDSAFFGFTAPNDLVECTLIARNGLYVTIDNLVVGYHLPCFNMNGIGFCDDKDAFKARTREYFEDNFDDLVEKGEIGSPIPRTNGAFEVVYSEANCGVACTLWSMLNDFALTVGGIDTDLVIELDGNANAIGFHVFTTDASDDVIPGRLFIQCGNSAFVATFTARQNFVAFVLPEVASTCTIRSESGQYPTVDDVIVGYADVCRLAGPVSVVCENLQAVLDNGFARFRKIESFAGAGTVGSSLADYTSIGSGFSAAFQVPGCSQDCVHISPNNALTLSSTKTTFSILFSTWMTTFGGNIYTVNEKDEVVPGRVTLTCGDVSETRTVLDSLQFVSISQFDGFTSCTIKSETDNYLTVDNVIFGATPPPE